VNGLIDPVTVVAQIKSDLLFKGPHALTRNAAAALNDVTSMGCFDVCTLPVALRSGGDERAPRSCVRPGQGGGDGRGDGVCVCCSCY
jgi:hypothetical protein